MGYGLWALHAAAEFQFKFHRFQCCFPVFTEAQGTYPTESGSTVLSKASKVIKPRPVASDGTCPDKAKAKGHRKLAWLLSAPAQTLLLFLSLV